MLSKLKSRKFWVTFAGAAAVLFLRKLGFEITEDQLYALATMVTGYNVGQAMVDMKSAIPSTKVVP